MVVKPHCRLRVEPMLKTWAWTCRSTAKCCLPTDLDTAMTINSPRTACGWRQRYAELRGAHGDSFAARVYPFAGSAPLPARPVVCQRNHRPSPGQQRRCFERAWQSICPTKCLGRVKKKKKKIMQWIAKRSAALKFLRLPYLPAGAAVPGIVAEAMEEESEAAMRARMMAKYKTGFFLFF